MVAYFERRGQDCLLQSPVTLYSFRQKLWVFALVLDIFMKVGSILHFERAKVMVDDVPDQLVRVHVVDEDSGVSKEIFLLPNFYGKRKFQENLRGGDHVHSHWSRRNRPTSFTNKGQGQAPRHVHSRQTNKHNNDLSFQPRSNRSYQTRTQWLSPMVISPLHQLQQTALQPTQTAPPKIQISRFPSPQHQP